MAKSGISRRDFLKQGTVAGLGALLAPSLGSVVLAASKERLTILNSVAIATLNPYAHSASPQYGIWQHVLEPLVEVDYERKEFYGVLAESWEFQGKKWVFHIRKGIRCHNGQPFTAKDVVYSINRIKTDKRSLQGSNFRHVTEMEAPDDYTVVITTKKPSAVLLDRLHNRFMMSRASEGKSGGEGEAAPIGTGPYKIVSFQRDGNFVVNRNEDYWGPKPEIKEIVIRKVGEDAARVSGLLAGQGDVINNVPVEEIPRIQGNPRVHVEKAEGLRMYFLALNPAHKPFDNKLVRQAVNYSIDPGVIVKNIYDSNGSVMNGPLSSNVIGFDPKTNRYPFDPKKARALLAQAGYPDGVEVKLYYSPDRYPKAKEVCQVLADQLQKGGIKTEIVAQQFVVFWGKEGVNGGKLPFYYVGRPAIDADTLYDQYFRSGRTKRVDYKNPEFDKLMDQQQTTGDQKKRAAILQQCGRILMEDVPLAPLYTLSEIYGVANNIAWRARPDEKVLVTEMKVKG